MDDSSTRPLNSGYLLLSILLTLLVYGAFWMIAEFIQVSGNTFSAAVIPPVERQIIRTVDLPELERLKELADPTRIDNQRLKSEQHSVGKVAPNTDTMTDVKAEISADVKAETLGVGSDLVNDAPKPTLETVQSPPQQLAQSAPALLADPVDVAGAPLRDTSGGNYIPDLQGLGYPEGPLVSMNGRGDHDIVHGAPPGGPSAIDLQLRLAMPQSGPPRLPGGLGHDVDLPSLRDVQLGADDAPEVGNLDDLMKVTIRVYKDPVRGGGYYEVTIEPNEENDRLKPIAHDAMLIIDSSASMTNRVLDHYKFAVGDYLSNISGEDRFNLITFRQTSRAAFPEWRHLDPTTLREGKDFLMNLSAKGKTDVYGGLAPYITQDRGEDRFRPLQVFLISDGRTTVKESLESNAFVRAISNNNKSDAAIFTVSAGAETDLFLMEFLAYNNQGVSLHLYNPDDIRDRGADFMSRLNQIIVSDPSCTLLDSAQHELYPRQLPHLYRRFPLRLYGRFAQGVTDVGLRITGYSYGHNREELVIFQDLNECEQAGREIATAWAGQKIYHLTNEWIHSQNADVRAEARRVAADYNLVIPY